MQSMGFIRQETQSLSSSILVPKTFTHSIAFGQTGSGKTTGFIYPNLISRINSRHGILLYDYKGKEHLSVKYLAKHFGRLDDVIEIGKPWGKYINIIEQMGEEDFDHFFDTILNHGEDSKFWHNSAKSLANSVLKILKDISSFSKIMKSFDKDFNKNHIKAGKFYYPNIYTLPSLIKVCQTFDKLSSFIDNLDALIEKTDEIIRDIATKDIKQHKNLNAQKPKYASLIRARKRLIKTIKTAADSLDGVGKDSNENLTQNIIGSLISPLFSLAQNEFFNTNNFDVLSALNSGKIIIINSEALSDTVLESFNNVILNQLTARTRNIHNNPVSIFIDEAQRVLSADTDLPVDVLREAKVDIFLAVQNSSLLKNKLEQEKYEALLGNLTSQFYFKNSVGQEFVGEYDLSELEPFEFISNRDNFQKVHLSKALHVSLSPKLKVEHEYQLKREILLNYAYSKSKENIVLQYDSHLYKNDELITIDIESLKQLKIKIHSKFTIENINSEINNLIQSVIQEINEDNTHKYEYEYFDEHREAS